MRHQEFGSIRIYTVPVSAYEQNCRILVADTECVVIDPGSEEIVGIIKEKGIVPQKIWLTHSHFDHYGGVKAVQDSFACPLIGRSEGRLLRSQLPIIKGVHPCPEPDEFFGEKVTFGGFEFRVLFTPGHAPDHVVLYSEQLKILIAGDLIFAGSIGRTDLPLSDNSAMQKSLQLTVAEVKRDVAILSGHGPDTTMARELDANPFLMGMS